MFIVNRLSHETLIYDPAANSDVDGDSDGTKINVPKPIKQTLPDWLHHLFARFFNIHAR
jgi:hypothetical protein